MHLETLDAMTRSQATKGPKKHPAKVSLPLEQQSLLTKPNCKIACAFVIITRAVTCWEPPCQQEQLSGLLCVTMGQGLLQYVKLADHMVQVQEEKHMTEGTFSVRVMVLQPLLVQNLVLLCVTTEPVMGLCMVQVQGHEQRMA